MPKEAQKVAKKGAQPGVLGILGGGQLALMLAEAASALGVQSVVAFTSHADDPVSLTSAKISLGQASDAAALARFFREVDVVIFENEFVDTSLLTQAAEGSRARFFPSLEAIREFQDKWRQKQRLMQLGIPTAPAFLLGQDWRAKLRDAFVRAPGWVLKWSKFGYDGKGVKVVDSVAEIDACAPFIESAAGRGVSVYAEQKVRFSRELALVSVATGNGAAAGDIEWTGFPLVESRQERGICKRALGPLAPLDAELEKSASLAARKLAQASPLRGVYAIEFFDSAELGLCVNEIAPRVHNSGHFSIEGCRVSQFEAHVRAALGMAIPPIESKAHFEMLNLLGPDGGSQEMSGALASNSLKVPTPAGVYYHWYGKREVRPGRKLGHVTAVSDAPIPAALLDAFEKDWLEKLRSSIT